MIRNTTVAIALLFSSTVFSQNLVKKNKLPGVVPVKGDYLYMAETEVSNASWKEYTYWLKKHAPEQFHAALPDTTVWKQSLTYCEPFRDYYFRHPAYNNYPVVGITQKQAQEYCLWLRNRLLESSRLHNWPYEDIIVRLPSREEWEFAALGGLPAGSPFPWKGESPQKEGGKRKEQGKYRLNFRRINGSGAASYGDYGLFTTPVYSYWPNGYGLYNICGNVAEWIEEDNCSKGGSWNQHLYHCRIGQPGPYDGDTSARADIGFRYVIELVKTRYPKQKPPKISAKTIEKQFSRVDTGLLLARTELRNDWYRAFVRDGHADRRTNDSLWFKHSRYHYRLMYSTHPNTSAFPVVNVSYQDANAYCEWLTAKYMADPRRKHKNVRFRLPFEDEWIKAAHGNRPHSRYPWGGPYLRNSRGNYLLNFHPYPEQYIAETEKPPYFRVLEHDTLISMAADGLVYTGPVTSYFPNSAGLYCMSGNAAEMLSEYPVSKGGSWNSPYWRVGIDGLYDCEFIPGPDPTLGFRVLMEVLDENGKPLKKRN